MKDMDDAFQRANLYVSIYVMLRYISSGEEVPVEVAEFLEAVGVEVPKSDYELVKYIGTLTASAVRTDLPPASRNQLRQHVKAFMTQAGYEVPETADSLLTMAAFAARLAIDAYVKQLTDEREADRLWRLLTRFLNTHLLPTLRLAKPTNQTAAKTLTTLANIIKEDVQDLAKKFQVTIFRSH